VSPPVGTARAVSLQETPACSTEPGAEASKRESVRKVAAEFEAILVRQLLASAKIGGGGSSGGYGDMAVDALATGITQSGGLGLARILENAIAGTELRDTPGKSRPP
jgi:Rod binding domain-containing protein